MTSFFASLKPDSINHDNLIEVWQEEGIRVEEGILKNTSNESFTSNTPLEDGSIARGKCIVSGVFVLGCF